MVNPQIFREYDIRGIADKDLTDEAVIEIAHAYGTYLRERGKRTASLGRDCRLSSPRVSDAFIEGLLSTGIDVTDIGVVTSPIFYFSIVHLKLDGGAMITASHNPPEFNGCKVCWGKDTLYGEEIQLIRKMAEKGKYATGNGELKKFDVVGPYIKFMKDNFKFKRKLKVAVDAGNGTAGPIAPQILRNSGCEVIELYCDMDGRFPNHIADPTVPKNMVKLIETVKREHCDVGIGYDGDADRIGVVDDKGNLIYGDRLLILYAREVLERKPGAKIIGEVKSSQYLYRDIKEHGGVPIMWKTGHSLIKAKMREEKAEIAGEMSGHMFFSDGYFGFDDAIYASMRLLAILDKTGKSVSELLSTVPTTYVTPEIRIACPDDKKFEVVEQATKYFKQHYEVIDIDGARVVFPDGWGLVRASNTQPALVMRVEADTPERVEEIKKLIESKVAEFSK